MVTATSKRNETRRTNHSILRPGQPLASWQTWIALIVFTLTLITASLSFGSDGQRWLLWTMTLLLIALPTLPLAAKIFKHFPKIVYPFSMALGLLLLSFSSWTLSYLHILPFQAWSLLLILIGIALASWIKAKNRQLLSEIFSDPGNLTVNIVFANLFVLALAAWTYVRGLMPHVDGLEKFMDYGFMMTMMRSDWLPAKDMWLAGESINYYYFGQFVYTALSKLTGIVPRYSYNLSMASTLAYMFMLSAAIGWMLFERLSEHFRQKSFFMKGLHWLASLASAFFVSIAGNSHSFFYAGDGIGKSFLRWLQDRAIDVGQIDHFFFADSTRYIGYNPDVPDKTIHEFPYYSFLVSDLHAHVVNTVFVLLLLGILIAYYTRKRENFILASHIGTKFNLQEAFLHTKEVTKRLFLNPTLLLSGLLLAVFMMCNFWDFAIYLVVILFVLFSKNVCDEDDWGRAAGLGQFAIVILGIFLPFLFIEHALLALVSYFITVAIAYNLFLYKRNAFSRTGLQLSLVFFLAHLLSLPFNLRFEAISKTIKLTSYQSSPQQLFILWGPHIIVAILFSLYLLLRRAKKDDIKQASFINRMGGSWLIILLSISGIGLILAAEIIYVRDIYEAYYARANTMFKFTYQAFILLSLVLAQGLPVMLAQFISLLTKKRTENEKILKKAVYTAFSIAFAIILLGLSLMPAYYPFVATTAWVPDPKTSEWKGLDGKQWMDEASDAYGNIGGESHFYDLTADAAAIDWFNEEVQGQPTIIEAAGLSYTHLNRISAYTGLPTVLGWETHEWLWRTSKDTPHAYAELVFPKQEDVRVVYTWSDPERAKSVLRENKVEYIIIGQLEQLRYPDIDLDQLASLGETVFHQGLMRIVKINPYTIN